MGVTTSTARVWVGSLAHWNARPAETQVRYKRLGSTRWTTQTVTATANEWTRALPSIDAGWYRTVELRALTPGARYELQFGRITGTRFSPGGQCFFETFPEELPGTAQAPFSTMVASCFYNDEDNKRASAAYKKVYDDARFRPQVKFLVGDQVYADIGIPLFPLNKVQTERRFLEAYLDNWRALSGLLRRGANYFLPDDHEFFNDYPFEPGLVPTLVALRYDAYRKSWSRIARHCVRNIEQTKPVRRFSVGQDLSFCVVDLRTQRTRQLLLPERQLAKVEAWANGLRQPGVLVLGQLLMRGRGGRNDHNPANYTNQYGRLVRSLSRAGHDIVVFTGDVHFGRIASAPLNGNGKRLIEIVSSPLSNLTGIYSISTSTADRNPSRFPPIGVSGVSQRPIQYHRSAAATGRDLFDYVKARTHEHFVTVDFQKSPRGAVKMSVNAWRARDGQGKLPAKAYAPWSTTLS